MIWQYLINKTENINFDHYLRVVDYLNDFSLYNKAMGYINYLI